VGDDMEGVCGEPLNLRSSTMVNFLAMTPRVVESARFSPWSSVFFFFGRLDLADFAGLASMGVKVATPATGWPDVRRLAPETGRFDFITGDETEVRGVLRLLVVDCHDLVRVFDC
jgi:hypothetical protein